MRRIGLPLPRYARTRDEDRSGLSCPISMKPTSFWTAMGFVKSIKSIMKLATPSQNAIPTVEAPTWWTHGLILLHVIWMHEVNFSMFDDVSKRKCISKFCNHSTMQLSVMGRRLLKIPWLHDCVPQAKTISMPVRWETSFLRRCPIYETYADDLAPLSVDEWERVLNTIKLRGCVS